MPAMMPGVNALGMDSTPSSAMIATPKRENKGCWCSFSHRITNHSVMSVSVTAEMMG
jgi:hypothetical protein